MEVPKIETERFSFLSNNSDNISDKDENVNQSHKNTTDDCWFN